MWPPTLSDPMNAVAREWECMWKTSSMLFRSHSPLKKNARSAARHNPVHDTVSSHIDATL